MMYSVTTATRLELLGCVPCLGGCGMWLQLHPASGGPAPDGEAWLYFDALNVGALCALCGSDADKREDARARWSSAEHTIRTRQRADEDWREYIKRIMTTEPM